MADTMVSSTTGVMNSLLTKLSMLLGDEYKLVKGVHGQVEFLKSELSGMNVLLKKIADMDELDIQMKAWRDNVRELAYDIEDRIDMFMYRLGRDDENSNLIYSAGRMTKEIWMCSKVAEEIEQLRRCVMEESQRCKIYKVDMSTSSPKVVKIDPRVPAFYAETEMIVGIDGPREEIIQFLMEDFAKTLKVVSIVGFGGLGKTTLANQVFRKIKDKFHCSAFVSMSQNPNMLRILKDILSGIKFDSKELPDDPQKLIDRIREHLEHKRYLFI